MIPAPLAPGQALQRIRELLREAGQCLDAIEAQLELQKSHPRNGRASKEITAAVDSVALRADAVEQSLPKKSSKLSPCEKILWAFKTYGPLTRAQVYYFTGVSPTSSTSNTAYADLIEDGLIAAKRNKALSITTRGLDSFSHIDAEPPNPKEVFEAFCNRQTSHLQKILRAHAKDRGAVYRREVLCSMAGVSLTSSSTNTAMARLGHLKIAIIGRGELSFELWYLKAIAPTVSVFDLSKGTTRRHDAVEGKPL